MQQNKTESNTDNKKESLIQNIHKNYQQLEHSFVEQLYMKHDLHGTTIGTAREDIWEQLFEMIVPKKFVLEHSVFIIDSSGRVSHEVDLAIIDQMYTPYIFHYGKVKFIPIEAVAVVVECKSTSLDKTSLTKCISCLDELKTSTESITRTFSGIAVKNGPAQKSTRPVRILCALKDAPSEISNLFDITLTAIQETQKIIVKVHESFSKLTDCYQQLNFHKEDADWKDAYYGKYDEVKKKLVKLQNIEELDEINIEKYIVKDKTGENISLLSLNFQLNQLLMLINNPMMFPHRAYVDLFNRGDQHE